MTERTIEKLADDINGFMKENCKPEMIREVIEAADGPHIYEKDRIAAITKAILGVAGTLLAVQKIEIEDDRIEGLQSDLESAVQVAYNHGAEEWARLNYPSWVERLEANKRAAEARKC
ncbi:hypothetical protein OIU34_20020 [Pararhizobium sp. BT-229]|uniref:hypothetical protein n=1 Tax=Pararhizobium sp. BT-229 TaxID=2986923 RepID=UPI0021F6D143|nr:hypothetical protein [Pararhizobium sp. BT-229]MCV9964174.1 hypothetical protein [Pararhizobium sp. BT-229]